MRTLTLLLALLSLRAIAQPQNTLDQRVNYLTNLYNTHRAINYHEDSVLVVSGFRTPEHLAAIDSLQRTENYLAQKVKTYLNTYGYPEKDLYGEIPNITPILILQQSTDYTLRRSQINHLYKAYKNEDLELRRFIKFLESEYELRFHRNYQSILRDEQRLDDLMRALELKVAKL